MICHSCGYEFEPVFEYRYYLLCGDSLKTEDVERLMQDTKADLFLTDPPYGVGYVEKAKAMHRLGYVHSRASLARPIQGDGQTKDDRQIGEFVRGVFAIWWERYLKPGGCFYLCCSAGHTETTFRSVVSGFYPIRQCLVWVKNNFVIGRQDYHWRHESILYGWKDGAAHFFSGDRTQDTVWEEARDAGEKMHPTMKPVALFERMIENSSRPGEIVVDPFLGSGTTMVAAERSDRRCFGMEIEPAYCSVVLERMAGLGMESQRIE